MKLKCPTCGQMLDAGTRFCPNDGTPLSDTAASQGVTTPVARPPARKDIDLPAIVGGRYQLLELRGGGGMAKVYRSLDTTLQREVAVKLINPELREETEFDRRFQREALTAGQLSDPHIVPVHDFGLDSTYGPYLVMEYLQGMSLRERLQASGPMPFKSGLQLSR